jgi:uncharacterized damage-inducible protein DinB
MNRQGRPRRYKHHAPDHASADFADARAAAFSEALDELRARVMDQIADLPSEALRFVPEQSTLSIAALVEHLVWAEAGWIEQLTGASTPADLRAAVDDAGRAVPSGATVVPELCAGELVALCHRIRDELTLPALAVLSDIDAGFDSHTQPDTARGVLMHLIWHWTYHSGQIGLLRELWGMGYAWAFAPTDAR